MAKKTLRLDIISDVVCPWCIVGFKRLESVFSDFPDVEFDVHWHPFELNPQMAAEGENLKEHIKGKYGTTDEESAVSREKLRAFGAEYDFAFNYADDMRMYNTFDAHRLLYWAQTQGKQHELKLALFEAFFSRRENIGDRSVLVDVAVSVGLNRDQAKAVLEEDQYHNEVRGEEQFWQKNGIQGVPAVVFEKKYLVTGAHSPEGYKEVVGKLVGRL